MVQIAQSIFLGELIMKDVHGRMIRAIWPHLGIISGFDF